MVMSLLTPYRTNAYVEPPKVNHSIAHRFVDWACDPSPRYQHLRRIVFVSTVETIVMGPVFFVYYLLSIMIDMLQHHA